MALGRKQRSYIFAGGVLGYILFLFFYHDTAIKVMAQDGFLLAFVHYLFYNPAYVLLILSIVKIFKRNILKEVAGGISLIVALEMISMPRIALSEVSSSIVASQTNLGYIAINGMIANGITASLAYNLYYWVIPTGLVVLAMWLLGLVKLQKTIQSSGSL